MSSFFCYTFCVQRKINSAAVTQMRELRQKGYSLSEIAQKMHIANSTASHYVGSMLPRLTVYRKLLMQKRGGSKLRKAKKEENALREARSHIQQLSKKEKLLFIAALYWAEGSKSDFGLSNTDPLLIQAFVGGLRSLFHIKNDRLRVSIRIYEDLDKETCLQFWSEVVKIPKEKFVNVNILKGKKIGKLTYGMCRVRVSKAELLLKKLQATYSIAGKRMSL